MTASDSKKINSQNKNREHKKMGLMQGTHKHAVFLFLSRITGMHPRHVCFTTVVLFREPARCKTLTRQ